MILRIDVRFGLVAGQEAHGPGKLARLVPHRGARGDEQLRDLLRVQIGMDGLAGVGAEACQNKENVVFLDELARHLHRLGRIVGVVIGNEVDLAAVDAALGVDLVEIGRQHLADHAIGGSRTGIGHGVADPDFVGARRRSALPESRPGHRGKQQRRCSAAPRRAKSRRTASLSDRERDSSMTYRVIVDSPHCSPPYESMPIFVIFLCAYARRRAGFQPCSPTLCLNLSDFVANPRERRDMVTNHVSASREIRAKLTSNCNHRVYRRSIAWRPVAAQAEIARGSSHRRELDRERTRPVVLVEIDPLVDRVRLVLPCAEGHRRNAVADHPVGIQPAIRGADVRLAPMSDTAATARLTTGRLSFMRNG